MCEVASVSHVDAVTHTVAIQRVIVRLIVHDMMYDIAHIVVVEYWALWGPRHQ